MYLEILLFVPTAPDAPPGWGSAPESGFSLLRTRLGCWQLDCEVCTACKLHSFLFIILSAINPVNFFQQEVLRHPLPPAARGLSARDPPPAAREPSAREPLPSARNPLLPSVCRRATKKAPCPCHHSDSFSQNKRKRQEKHRATVQDDQPSLLWRDEVGLPSFTHPAIDIWANFRPEGENH